MWSRAKRTGRGSRIDPGLWVPGAAETDDSRESMSEMSEGDSEEDVTERGYGSDRERVKRD